MISPIDIATDGYLTDPLSISTNGYITVQVEIIDDIDNKGAGGGFSYRFIPDKRFLDDEEIVLCFKIFLNKCL